MSKPYRWWPVASADQLRDQLNAHPGAIIKQHIDSPELLHVHPASGTAATEDCPPPIDDSHLCPPVCP